MNGPITSQQCMLSHVSIVSNMLRDRRTLAQIVCSNLIALLLKAACLTCKSSFK